MLRDGADRLFGQLAGAENATNQSSAEIRSVAALNGVFGDHLETTGNVLATRMGIRHSGELLELNREAVAKAFPEASPNLTVFVHGLSLSELCWNRKGAASVGARLQQDLGHTSLHLRYNTGRHISTNGQEFSELLGHLIGDLLVRLDSAVGSHTNDLKKLHIQEENCRVFHEKNHFDLLDDERVHDQIIAWFQ